MAWKNYYKSHSINYTIPIEKLEGLLWEKFNEVKMVNENGEREWWTRMVNGEWWMRIFHHYSRSNNVCVEKAKGSFIEVLETILVWPTSQAIVSRNKIKWGDRQYIEFEWPGGLVFQKLTSPVAKVAYPLRSSLCVSKNHNTTTIAHGSLKIAIPNLTRRPISHNYGTTRVICKFWECPLKTYMSTTLYSPTSTLLAWWLEPPLSVQALMWKSMVLMLRNKTGGPLGFVPMDA